MSSSLAGSGQHQPPAVQSQSPLSPNAADFSLCDAPQLKVSRVECDYAPCLKRHIKRGQSHGAFLYELRWGVVEHAGVLLAAVSLQTVCHACGHVHESIEVPRSTAQKLLIQPT